MVRKINIQINLTNKLFYTFVTLIVIFAGIGVYAFGTSDPLTFGHSASELDLSTISGDVVFDGKVSFNSNTNLEFGKIAVKNAIDSTESYEFKNYLPIDINGQTYWFKIYGQIISPDAPSGLSAVDSSIQGTYFSINMVYLAWNDNSGNENSFELERSSTSSTSGFANVITLSDNTIFYYNYGMSSSNYWYRIRACNDGGCSAYSNVVPLTVDPATSSTSTYESGSGTYEEETICDNCQYP